MTRSKILVVEDENIIAKDICITLERLGYAVAGMVAEGEQAVRKTAELKPDLVLMDIMLKGKLNGIDAAERIRSGFDIPVIYLTAFSDEVLLKKAKVSEAFGYLIKPFRENELRAVIEMALYKHRIDKELKKSLRLYNAVVEDQTELICRYTPGMVVTFINMAYCRYLGKTRDEIIGNSYLDLIDTGDRARIEMCLSSLSPENSMVTIEQRLTMPLDEMLWQEFNHRALYDDHKRLCEFQAVGRDITERKKAEEALANEAIRRRILVEESSDGIVVLDQDGKAFETNRRFAEMLGCTTEETLQLHVWDWDARWNREQLLEKVRLIDSAGDHFETRHRRKDGSMYDVEISTNGALISGKKLVFCVCRDITERKKAEKAVRESEIRFRTLFENIPLTVLIYDESGVILHINEIGLKQLNWEKSELIGSSIGRIKPEGQESIDSMEGSFEFGSRYFTTFFLSPERRHIFAEVWESKILYNECEAILCVVKLY